MAEPRDVAIIGAGVAGLCAARALAAAGQRVVVIERGEPWAEASAASAGMLAPQIEAHAGDALLHLGLAARERHVSFAAELAAAGHDIGHAPRGILHLALDEQSAAALREQQEAQRAIGLDAQWLNAHALRRRQPGVARGAAGALFAPRDGSVDSLALGRALLDVVTRAGVEIVRDAACEVAVRGGRVTGVHGAAAHYECGTVVLAAGAWACTLAGVPPGIPVEPVRGQMAALPWPAGEPKHVLYADVGYIVPRGNEALVGATMEHTGFEKGTTTEGQAQLRAAADTLLPALAATPFTRTWSGLRPMTPDGLPIIGLDPDVSGLVYAAGYGRNGILLGPLAGYIVRDLVMHGTTSQDVAACSVTRFSR